MAYSKLLLFQRISTVLTKPVYIPMITLYHLLNIIDPVITLTSSVCYPEYVLGATVH